jgi:hypothetical protein
MTDKKTMLEKIYDKYALLKDEAKVDCLVDRTNLDSGFNVTMNLTKWITKKTEWNRVFRDFEEKRKKAYRASYEYYQTEFPLKLSTKDEYNLFIESDMAYIEHYNNSLVIKDIINYIDSIIDTLKNKQWEIKNIITWEMFKNGR